MDWDNAFLLFPAPLQTELEWEDFSGPEAEPLLPSPPNRNTRKASPSLKKEGRGKHQCKMAFSFM